MWMPSDKDTFGGRVLSPLTLAHWDGRHRYNFGRSRSGTKSGIARPLGEDSEAQSSGTESRDPAIRRCIKLQVINRYESEYKCCQGKHLTMPVDVPHYINVHIYLYPCLLFFVHSVWTATSARVWSRKSMTLDKGSDEGSIHINMYSDYTILYIEMPVVPPATNFIATKEFSRA